MNFLAINPPDSSIKTAISIHVTCGTHFGCDRSLSRHKAFDTMERPKLSLRPMTGEVFSSKNGGSPIAGWFIMDTPIGMDDGTGVALFREASRSRSIYIYIPCLQISYIHIYYAVRHM